MSISSKLNQAASKVAHRVGRTAGVAAGTAERWAASLPRPLAKLSDKELGKLLGNSIARGTALGIMMKTGKVLNLGLVDRRQNRFGKVLNVIGLVASVSSVALAAHEQFMRTRDTQLSSMDEEAFKRFQEMLRAL